MDGVVYEKLKKIGEGTYGKVYKALNLQTKSTVAVKRISLSDRTEGIPGTAIREISLLKELDHPNIIRLEHAILKKDELYLIFEYLPLDLSAHLSEVELFPWLIKDYMQQICSGIDYCHSRGILHRDLKPDNILLTTDNHLKIADFGLSRTIATSNNIYSSEVVTLWYRAPELLIGCKHYTYSLDIWSIGCIFVEMFIRKAPFRAETEIDQLDKIFKILSTPNEKTWPVMKQMKSPKVKFAVYKENLLPEILKDFSAEVVDMAGTMLTYDPVKRPSAKRLLEHSYFSKPEKSTTLESLPKEHAKTKTKTRSRTDICNSCTI